jgi:hypothetical protein
MARRTILINVVLGSTHYTDENGETWEALGSEARDPRR